VKRVVCLALAAALLAGCGTLVHEDTDRVDRPDIAVGTGAAVIMPGQAAPAVTNEGARNPDGSPAGLETTMIGGTTGEATRSTKERKLPIIGPFTTLLGYPFWIFGKSVREKADQAQRQSSSQGPSAEPALTPDERERARLSAENDRLRRELEKQAGAPPAVSAAPTSAPYSPTRRGLIGAELAALERELGARAPAREPAPAPAPRTSAPEPDATRRHALDQDGDGRIDRIDVYDPSGRRVRSEEDLDGDGRMETVSVHDGDRLVRRRVDADGDGLADQWSFYEAGELVRHEVDRDGDGFRDVSTFYASGQVAREEEDHNRDGRPDVIARYANGKIAEREEDLDFDGVPDVRSFYQDGKLARREVRSEELVERGQGPDS
jgi:hypothetical protein